MKRPEEEEWKCKKCGHVMSGAAVVLGEGHCILCGGKVEKVEEERWKEMCE